MKKEQVAGLFSLAGIKTLRFEALIDGYGYSPDDPSFYEVPPRLAWWFVKTPCGWIKIGWRKRVIDIDWSDTPIRKIITEEETTKDESHVHAWSEEKALTYLKALAIEMNSINSEVKQ